MSGNNGSFNHKDTSGVSQEFIAQLRLQADDLADGGGESNMTELCQLVKRLTYLITALYRGGCSRSEEHYRNLVELDRKLNKELKEHTDGIKQILEEKTSPRFGWPAAFAYITTLAGILGIVLSIIYRMT